MLDALKVDFCESNQIEAEEKSSTLSADEQTNLVKHVRDFGNDWEAIKQKMGFEESKKAIIEYLRINLDEKHFEQLGSILGEEA